MIVSINQPAYLPWLGYFERIMSSDLHIVLDHVQFEKNSFVNRNKIRAGSSTCWLTVPVTTKGLFGQLAISDLQIDTQQKWREKHWRTIEQNYKKAPYFSKYAEHLQSIYHRPWDRLFDLQREMLTAVLGWLDIETQILYSSDLEPKHTKDKMVLELCQSVGADLYISGALGRDYLDLDLFKQANLQVVFQDYQHPTYRQFQKGPFAPGMGIIDLMFNCGPESAEIIASSSGVSEQVHE